MRFYVILILCGLFFIACNQEQKQNIQRATKTPPKSDVPDLKISVKDQTPFQGLHQVPFVEAKVGWLSTKAQLTNPDDLPHTLPETNTEYYRAEKTIRGKERSISIVFGDILKEKDAVVIPVNENFKADSPLALAVFEAAKIQDKDVLALEAEKYKERHKIENLPLGSALIFNSYALGPAISMIIAAHGPKGPLDDAKSYPKKQELFSALYNSLLKANEYDAKSVSISDISLESDGLPDDIVSEIYFKAAILFFSNNADAVQEIRFVSKENTLKKPVIKSLAENFITLFAP